MDGAGDSGAPDPTGLDTRDDDPLLRAIARAPSVDGVSRQGEPLALLGEVLDGKYRVDAVLGRGGMGAVYRATHVETRREVALKVLLPELTAQESLVERFRREAQAAGQLRHRNIVDVTDFGFAARGDDRVAYLVMELVRGETLRAVLERVGRLSLEAAVDILDQVCAAMSEAHRLGVLHRDLKPENILLESAGSGHRVKVVDFGIAKRTPLASVSHASTALPPSERGTVDAAAATVRAVDGHGSGISARATTLVDGSGVLTRRGSLLGTPLYMSPEQWRGGDVDARTDVYSLGVVAYEILAGEPPFLGKTRWIALEHAEDPPPPLAARAPQVPRRLTSVIEAALAKKPDDRPPSVAAFAASLHAGRETTASLLRRSVALTFNHYGVLSLCCAAGSLPTLGVGAVVVATYVMARLGAVSAPTPVLTLLGGTVVLALWSIFVSNAVAGLLVRPVADLLDSRSVGRRPSLADVVRTALGSLPSSLMRSFVFLLILMAWMLAVFVAGVIAGILGARPLTDPLATGIVVGVTMTGLVIAVLVWAAFSSLVGPVVAVERPRGLAPLRRSFTLVRPVRRAAFGVTLFYTVLSPALGWILDRAFVGGAAAPSSPAPGAVLPPYGFLMATFGGAAGRTLLSLPITVLLTPFTLVPFALLYIRAREAEGKPLDGER
ncbi:MAG TPA: protein kinase [Polyangiaceae bacterium]|jgi:serine/threonine protein kinase